MLYYDDNGTILDHARLDKPTLCRTCKKESDPDQEILCTLNRFDQEDNDAFICYAYEDF